MNLLQSMGEALPAIDRFLVLHARELDEASLAAMLEASAKVSPVDKIVGVAELLYSIRAELHPDGLTLAGQLIEFAARNGWHGLQVDARGSRMVDAIRRELGEDHPTGGEWPAPDTDPAPALAGAIPAPAVPLGSAPELPPSAPA